MADSSTTNFGFTLVEDGGSENTWGVKLNTNTTEIDTALKALQDEVRAMRIPVGGLYCATTTTDPATQLGYGTWEEYAAGRALASRTNTGVTPGTNFGSQTKTIATGNLPAHTHGRGTLAVVSSSHSHGASSSFVGNHSHTYTAPVASVLTIGGGAPVSVVAGGQNVATTASGGHSHSITVNSSSHTHGMSGSTASAGSGTPLNVEQPSIYIVVWRRTA